MEKLQTVILSDAIQNEDVTLTGQSLTPNSISLNWNGILSGTGNQYLYRNGVESTFFIFEDGEQEFIDNSVGYGSSYRYFLTNEENTQRSNILIVTSLYLPTTPNYDKTYFLNITERTPKRFDFKKFMEYEKYYDIITSEISQSLKEIPVYGNFVVTEEFRPDLISYKIYQDTMYWWIIMLYNDLTSIYQLTTGLTIKFPPLKAIEKYYYNLKQLQENSK